MLHSLPYAANCSLLFWELPLLERPAAAAAVGFEAIEFWWPFAEAVPDDVDVDAFVEAVQDAGVRLIGLNFAAGDMPTGDRGLVSWPQRTAEFRDHVEVAIGIGERLNVGAFNALYGNRVDGVRPEEQDEQAVDNLVFTAEAAMRIRADVLLEPLSGAPRYPLRTADEVVDVLDRASSQGGGDNLRMLLDLYHLAVNGDDLPAVIETHATRVGHVQIADAPGRHEPGTGELDLERHLSHLEAEGYDGWVALEYTPASETVAGLAWLPEERRSGVARNR